MTEHKMTPREMEESIKNDFMLKVCPSCAVIPGMAHLESCNVERCSICGSQYRCCGCDGHDKLFARWTGVFPGEGEAKLLGFMLPDGMPNWNGFFNSQCYKAVLIKPLKSPNPNQNCLEGMKCPRCSSYGPFRIDMAVRGYATVTDDGHDEIRGDTEWPEDGTCECCECRHSDFTHEFREENQ